jgi:LssY C-terminus
MLRDFSTLFAVVTGFIVVRPCVAVEMVAGTRLETRLAEPTGSRISHAGDPVEAVVIAPVFVKGRLFIPQGAIVSGVVERVERVGLGLKHATSSLGYRFDTLRLPEGAAVPVHARVVEVETAKERVNPQGVIGGIYPTANLSSTIDFYVLPLLYLDPGFGAPMLGIKFLIARSPDPEIYFAAGTELILEFTADVNIPNPGAPPNEIAPLSPAEMAEVHRLLAGVPEQRTHKGGNRPSDLVNILLLGRRDSIDRAFQAAGWSGAQPYSPRSIYRMYHCMVQRIGYSMAPMWKLRLNGVIADAEYQKSLNTFSKRHHLRLWKQGQEDAWLTAATEDVGYKVRTMHLTHATDPLIDNERAKVVNDLTFTGCVPAATLMTRDSSAGLDQQEASIRTDGKIAVLRINDCRNPRTMPAQSAQFGPHARRRSVQALVAVRNDLIRANPVSLAYDTIRGLRDHENSKVKGSMSAFRGNLQQPDSPENRLQPPAWIRPNVLDARTTTADPRP